MNTSKAVVQVCTLVVLLVAYVVVGLPSVMGVAAHEWLGLALVVLLLVHAALRSKRFESGARRASARRLARLVLDAALLVSLAVCAVSGVMVSGAVLPTFGLFADGYYLWNPMHAVSAKVLLALLLVHLALNIGSVVRRTRHTLRNADEGGLRDGDLGGASGE